MNMLDLFSGIGGFALAAQWAWGDELNIVSFCEKDKYCQRVLKKHWPMVPILEDVRDVSHASSVLREAIQRHEQNGDVQSNDTPIDIITGGFPCQPVSHAGKRMGRSDDRYLWPEMFRVVQLFEPTWVIAENVPGLMSIEDGVVFEQVCSDLEGQGYDVWPLVIPAVAVDAKHRRDRVWIVAYRQKRGLEGCGNQREGGEAGSSEGQPLGQGDVRRAGNRTRHPGTGVRTGSDANCRRQQEQRLKEHGGQRRSCWNQPDGLCQGRRGNGTVVPDSQEQPERSRRCTCVQGGERRRRPCNCSSEGGAPPDATGKRSQGLCRCGEESGTGEASKGKEPSGRGREQAASNADGRQREESLRRDNGGMGRLQQFRPGPGRCEWLPEPDVGRVADGIPHRVDRLRALGNAIVPQVAYQLFLAIREQEATEKRRKSDGNLLQRLALGVTERGDT